MQNKCQAMQGKNPYTGNKTKVFVGAQFMLVRTEQQINKQTTNKQTSIADNCEGEINGP